MDAVQGKLWTALHLLFSLGIYVAVAQDDEDDDDDKAMLIFAYVAFGVGGLLILLAIILLLLWLRKMRNNKRKQQRYLSRNFQTYSSAPWLTNTSDTHRVKGVTVDEDDTEPFTDIDVRTFEERRDGAARPDSPRTREAKQSVGRSGSSLSNAQALATATKTSNVRTMPLPGTMIDGVSSEESSATHTSTSPIISPKSRLPEPEPDYDYGPERKYETATRPVSSQLPRIVAELEPPNPSTYPRPSPKRDVRPRSGHPNADMATSGTRRGVLKAATDREDPRAPSDFAVDGVFLNANSLERTVYGQREVGRVHSQAMSTTSTVNSLRSGRSAYVDEALPGDQEVIYNVTLTVT